ncbi:MAG: SHOCT domain-containing protein [Deltaproteobacteria bacterium]|nr:SHOCT domain-containing protein [Deltaproteobacteria bacterium]
MPGWGVWGPMTTFFMSLFWIAILVLIIVGIVFLVRYMRGHGTEGRCAQETPLDILKKRYVRCEIDKKEFEEKKKDLI